MRCDGGCGSLMTAFVIKVELDVVVMVAAIGLVDSGMEKRVVGSGVRGKSCAVYSYGGSGHGNRYGR